MMVSSHMPFGFMFFNIRTVRPIYSTVYTVLLVCGWMDAYTAVPCSELWIELCWCCCYCCCFFFPFRLSVLLVKRQMCGAGASFLVFCIARTVHTAIVYSHTSWKLHKVRILRSNINAISIHPTSLYELFRITY